MGEPTPAAPERLFDVPEPAAAPPGLTPADLDVPDTGWRRAARSEAVLVTRAELVELLTVERFAPYVPPGPVERRRRRRPKTVPIVGLDDPAVIEARRRAVDEEVRALWHDDAEHELGTTDERSA